MSRDPLEELRGLDAAGLLRHLRRVDSPQGSRVLLPERGACLNFSSNDYLGLANDPELKSLFQEQIARHGVGSGASRLVCGTLAPHQQLEDKLAALKNSEAALTFASGFAAALGILPAICQKGDIVILDKLSHASLIDGAKLSGATLRVFPHNDLHRLKEQLQWAGRQRGPRSRVLIITESVFSMDGDLAPLEELCALKEAHDALLLVDEAHAFGVLGPQGRGLAADLGVERRIDFQMGTFSKAVGLSGGYVCASRAFVDWLINRARSFVYSTAPSPALAATIAAGLDLITGPRGDQLREILRRHRETLRPGHPSAILPLILGENERALAASAQLLERGLLVPAIRYPTVPRGSARLRITLSAAHHEADIRHLQASLDAILAELPER